MRNLEFSIESYHFGLLLHCIQAYTFLFAAHITENEEWERDEYLSDSPLIALETSAMDDCMGCIQRSMALVGQLRIRTIRF